MFRALGFISDKRILSLIIYDSDTEKLKNKLIELIRPSVKAVIQYLLKNQHSNSCL